MFNEKNPLYYSTNKELEKPEPESEKDFVGELHTATSVIAQVEDEDGAEEIVRRVNMQKKNKFTIGGRSITRWHLRIWQNQDKCSVGLLPPSGKQK